MQTEVSTKHSPNSTAAVQPEYIYFYDKPSANDLQRYTEALAQDAQLREVRRRAAIKGTWQMDEVIWELQEAGEPLMPVEIVNRVTNRMRFDCWEQKYAKRCEFLKVIGSMVRQGRLVRHERVRVRIPKPGEDHKFQTWIKEATQPLNLPKPRFS